LNRIEEEIKREPVTPPPLSRVISNEENKRRNEMTYNSNHPKTNSSFANSRNDSYLYTDSYKHFKSSDKNHSNYSRGNSKKKSTFYGVSTIHL